MDASDPCSWTAPFTEVRGRIALARAGERAAADHLARTHGLVTVATNVRIAVEDLALVHDGPAGALLAALTRARLVGALDDVPGCVRLRPTRPSVR
jgi:hypothetical protein